MYGFAILIGVFLKNIAEAGRAPVAIFFASISIIIALCLPQWENNHYRWNINSIPVSVKTIFWIFAFCGFVFINVSICEYRLGGTQLIPNFFLAFFLQSVTLLIGGGIYLVSFPGEDPRAITPLRLLVVILVCALIFFVLNVVFYSDPGGLTAEFKPTRRCYPGGSCYNAGDEQWGGGGANLLLSVNLLQGILILNVLAGIVYFIKSRFLKNT